LGRKFGDSGKMRLATDSEDDGGGGLLARLRRVSGETGGHADGGRRMKKGKKRRVCEKSGAANVKYKNVSEKRRRYVIDLYTTLIDSRFFKNHLIHSTGLLYYHNCHRYVIAVYVRTVAQQKIVFSIFLGFTINQAYFIMNVCYFLSVCIKIYFFLQKTSRDIRLHFTS